VWGLYFFFLPSYFYFVSSKHGNMTPNTSTSPLTICIDRGGTFTDCIGFVGKPGDENYREYVVKLLSEDPSNYKDAPTEGIRRIVELATGQKFPRSEPVPTKHIGK
jgi:5-oxoprolinase (ATP-hydrolysing)